MKTYAIRYRTGFGASCLYVTNALDEKEAGGNFTREFPYYRADGITLL